MSEVRDAAVEYMRLSDQARVMQQVGQKVSASQMWFLTESRDRLDAVLPHTPRRMRRNRWWAP